jgi:hypothetical protein
LTVVEVSRKSLSYVLPIDPDTVPDQVTPVSSKPS